MTITRHGRRSWRVTDDDGSLVCVTAYLKGAREVVRRLRVARGEDAKTPTAAMGEKEELGLTRKGGR